MYEKTYVLGVINKETVINTEEKVFTPTTSVQTYIPTSGTYISKVTVNAISTETKTVTPSASSQSVIPTSGKYLSKVTINAIPSSYVIPSGTKSITSNGTSIDVSSYKYVDVNVASSGGSGEVVPTCTLTVRVVACIINVFMYSRYSPVEGIVTAYEYSLSSGQALILDNVVCGSLIVFDTNCAMYRVTFSYDELPVEPPASDYEKGYLIANSRSNILWCQAPMYSGEYSVTVEDWD